MKALEGILFFVLASSLFVAVAFLVSKLLRPNRPNREKLSTYESGEDTVGTAWMPFNYRFYGYAVLFVLFEVELIFLLPFVYALGGSLAKWILIEVIAFMLLLVVGLVYAWKKGFLQWQKAQNRPYTFESKVPKELYLKFNSKS